MNNYIIMVLFGAIGKIYDDLVELYMIKNDRLIETIKTFWTILIFYFIFNVSSNGYDILFILFIWTFLPLVDWAAFTEDPYFFSLTLFITIIGITTIILKKFTFNYLYLPITFFLYCICTPITEMFMFEINGIIPYLLSCFKLVKNESIKLSDISIKDLEVSHKKLITRIISVLFLSSMIMLMFFLRKLTTITELDNVYKSVIYLSIVNLSYFFVSVINQINVLYFNKDILNKLEVNEDRMNEENKELHLDEEMNEENNKSNLNEDKPNAV